MKLAFLGTPKVSAFILEELLKEHEVSWVISQTDKACGRGRKCLATPVKEVALRHNLCLYQPDKITKSFFDEFIVAKEIDLAIVIAYGQYIPSYLINAPKHYMLNIHFSLLPKYRGAAPVQRAILNGDKFSGVSIMKVAKGMDTGDVLAQKTMDIDINTDYETYMWDLAKAGLILLKKCINNISKLDFTKQDLSLVTYAPKITKSDAVFSWEDTALSIHNKVRVLSVCPGIFVKIAAKVLKIKKTKFFNNYDSISVYRSGQIVKLDRKTGIYIKCKDSVLLIQEVQVVGKKQMSISDFINGNKLELEMSLEIL